MAPHSNLLPGCSHDVPKLDCEDSRVTTRLFRFVPDIPSIVWTHKSCVCNEKTALSMRHQIDTGARYQHTGREFQVLKPFIKYIPATTEAVIIHHASSRKKKLLMQASESLLEKPIEPKDGAVRMFLKDDKYHTIKLTPPRCIQYRNKRYCLRLACYLHPIEKYVYSWTDISGTPVFAKCRNLQQRGADIAAKMDFFRNPVAISLDHSKFDAHVSLQLLDAEHRFYKACNRSPELKELLRLQRINHGVTKNGTRYTTVGTRMSGDQNTGLGNSLINFMMTEDSFGHIKHCVYIDGDDFIIFVEASDAKHIDPNAYSKYGMKTKLDSITSTIEHIDFCQTRPVFNGVSYTMVRNPARMLQRIQWAVGRFHFKHRINYLTSVGQCCMSLGMGLPIEQYIGATLANLGGKLINVPLMHSANRMFMRVGSAYVVEPSYSTRLSYEEAWGITPHQQIELERSQISFRIDEQLIAVPQYGEDKPETEETIAVPW